ncbi:DUF2271 domain-containing protein [Novosphingobium beihaiensis]|uniref:DUF2271 domain-containing protein n=1 Tax=Novosphingobium beihaiensis TaxID=2930389 RepID=A0ABT0BUV4_9SPHN|nr:DUF2271 domain-containing protein [Novosphingobium beihaiensis]MCJ2188831.1 DUF2271 domain-containing protein [Novosphingobium beihaiensis]
MRRSSCLALAAIVFPVSAEAHSGTVTVELPRISEANYRKPYVAVWLENASGQTLAVSGVMYDQARIGLRWLPELRAWWRKGGRGLEMPADGISMPTRGPGHYNIGLRGVETLPDGAYNVVVEAAREKAGREVVKVPVMVRNGVLARGSASGSRELGKISVAIGP